MYGKGEILIKATARNWLKQFPSPASLINEALLGYRSSNPFITQQSNKITNVDKIEIREMEERSNGEYPS